MFRDKCPVFNPAVSGKLAEQQLGCGFADLLIRLFMAPAGESGNFHCFTAAEQTALLLKIDLKLLQQPDGFLAQVGRVDQKASGRFPA